MIENKTVITLKGIDIITSGESRRAMCKEIVSLKGTDKSVKPTIRPFQGRGHDVIFIVGILPTRLHASLSGTLNSVE